MDRLLIDLQDNRCSDMEITTKETIVTNNLVVHVDADNRDSYPGSGTTWADLSGNGRNGTLTSTAIDYNKQSLIFNGGNEFVTFSQYDFGNEFTLNCFIKPSNISNIRALFSNSSTGVATNGVRIFINLENQSSRTLHMEIGNGSSGLYVSTGAIITYDTWQHVAFTLNKNTSKGIIYHNGIKVTESTLSFTNYNTNAVFRFGAIGNGGYVYVGALANYLLYNRALTESEIKQNYDNQKGRFFGQSNMTLSGISITQS